MTLNLDAIKARIRALLAKTVENGCTEGEALAAAEKAFAMLREHGLTEDQINIGRKGSPLNRSRRQPIDDLWSEIAMVCRCRGLFRIRIDGQMDYEFIGRAPWPDIADWLRTTLHAAHDRALAEFRKTKPYCRRRTPKTRAVARRQFTVGFVEAVARKLRRLIGDWDVVATELQLIDVAAASEFQGARDVAPLGHADNSHRAARDREAGQCAGHGTPVNWAVAGAAPKAIGGNSR